MQCRECNQSIGPLSDFITFIQNERSIHLVLKPENVSENESTNFIFDKTKKNKHSIHCRYCNQKHGKIVSMSAVTFHAISLEKITLNDRFFTKKSKWSIERANFDGQFEERDSQAFHLGCQPSSQKQSLTLQTFPLIPDYDDVGQITPWEKILKTKIPKDYQLEGYLEAIKSDSVFVLPTGYGKTLVAALLLAHRSRLFPNHVGLMVVEKIPLVDQHCQSLRRETDLKVVGLCGENVTQHKVDKVGHLQYDVLVITVESVLVRSDSLPLSLFHTIIMDECHHARGEHSYSRLLRALKIMPTHSRPRLLGLTATPIEVRSAKIESHVTKINTFLNLFPSGCRLICPDVGSALKKDQEWRICGTSVNQKLIENIIYQHMKQEVKAFPSVEPRWFVNQSTFFQCQGNIQGRLRTIMADQGNREPVKKLLAAVACVDLNYLLGVKFAVPILKDLDLAYPCQLDDSGEYSKRLTLLMEEINQRIENNENSKILVFVQKRDIAKVLHEFLLEEIPHCQPVKMVGHTGDDGMLWNGPAGQNEAINNFNDGESKVMVATSIVEEGLDIQSCDLVIRFSSNRNLIRHLQTRGRARKKDGRFVIIGSQEENQVEIDMLLREQTLHNIVKMKVMESVETKELVKELLSEDRVEEAQIMQQSFTSDYKIDKLSFKLYAVDVSNSIDLNNLKSAIEKTFFNCNVEMMSSVDGRIFSGCESLFPKSTAVFLVGFLQEDEDDAVNPETSIEKYANLCMYFSYKLSVVSTNVLLFSSMQGDEVSIQKYQLEMISFGRMKELQPNISITIVSKYSHVASFVVTDNSLQIIDEDKESVIDLKFTATYGYVLATVDYERRTVRLSIPYKIQPHTANKDCHVPKETNIMTLMINMKDAFNKLCQGFPLKVITSWIQYDDQTVEKDMRFESMFDLPHVDFDIMWQLKSLHDLMPLTGFNEFKNAVISEWNEKPFRRKNLLIALEIIRTDACLIFPLKKELMKLASDYDKFKVDDTVFDDKSDKYLMHNAVVTPDGKIIAGISTPMPESRLTRMFTDKRFITVSLRSEAAGKIADEGKIDKVQCILEKGIKIAGRKFSYLCASGSQLRDHKALFVETENATDVNNMRDVMIPEPSFSHISKYSSRLGLFATTGKILGNVDLKNDVEIIPDIKAINGTLLTDGCGKIKKQFLQNLLQTNEDLPHSAMQIRLSGSKGVLVIVDGADDPDFQNSSKNIILRESMVKFKSTNTELLEVSKSQYLPVTLNREIITLMEALVSSNSDFENALVQMQNEAILEMANRLQSSALAQRCLKQYIPSSIVDAVINQFSLVLEPFWFSLLQYTYHLNAKYLREKTNIPLKNGCRLMGVADPTLTLEPGHVFCLIENNTNDDFWGVLTGSVIIYRNPCLHPGDVRLVTATDNPKLRSMNLKNVLVFSASKESKTSIADECSGGDLDGDQFSIIWDENLVLGKSQIHQSLDYQEINRSSMSQHANNPLHVELNDQIKLSKFFADNMKNDALGRVANMHLALCDHLSATHELAKALARSQSVAVDFPKTGIIPLVPKEALEMVKNKGFPDFMEKEPSYSSDKLLGKLYRECQGFMFKSEVRQDSQTTRLDYSLILDGSNAYKDEATNVYKEFCLDMKLIMSRFDIKCEAELVLCDMLQWMPLLSSNRGKAQKSLEMARDSLWKKYRSMFENDCNQTKEQKCLKASAWYQVCYEDEKFKFKSFAWIIYQQLCLIKEIKSKHPHSKDGVKMERLIGLNCKNFFMKSSQRLLLKFEKAGNIQKEVQLALVNERVEMYGSASIFASGDSSDIDLLIYGDETAMNNPLAYLEGRVSPCLQQSAESVLIQQGRIPVLRCKMEIDDELIDIDISCNRTGFLKTVYIRSIYQQNPSFLVVFWLLVHWARLSGILKNFQDDISLIPTAEFYAIIIKLLDIKLDHLAIKQETNDLATTLKKIERERGDEIGRMILTFFRKATQWPEDSDLVYEWPNGIHSINVTCKLMKSISAMCRKALHILLCSRDIVEVLKNSSEQTDVIQKIVKRLPKGLSKSISANFEFFKTKLLATTGVVSVDFQIMKNTLDNTGDFVLMEAQGSRFAINKLCGELLDISSSELLPKGTQSGKYFMEGSQWIKLYGGENEDRVVFKQFNGKGHRAHRNKEICEIAHKSTGIHNSLDEYWRKLKRSLLQKLKTQLHAFPRDKPDILESLQFVARFGRVYVIEPSLFLSDLKTSVSLAELDSALLKGRTQRQIYKRNQFGFENNKQLMRAIPKVPECEMVPLPKVDGNHAREKTAKPLSKQRKTLLASSFISLWPDGKNVDFIQALQELGFVIGAGESRINHDTESKWNISLKVSISFEVTLLLDEQFRYLRMHERRVTWVHGSILDCPGSYDVRIALYSKEMLDDANNATKKLFPEGIPYGKPLFKRQEHNNRIAFSDNFPEASRNRVIHLRYTKEQYILVHPNYSTEALVDYSKHYYPQANQILLDDEGMEMSLRFNTKRLQQMIIANEPIVNIADETADEVLSQVQRTMELVSKKLEANRLNSEFEKKKE